MPDPPLQPNRPPHSLPPHEALIASVPKEAFKAMFYLFAGKPDSKVKLFHRPIVVRAEDIQDLHQKIISKLRLHQIDQIVASATVKFDKEESIEFGTWAEFESFDWKTARVTQELSIRWDFLIKLSAYAAAQRHTITVRMATTPRPRDVVQIIMSQDPDEDGDISGKMALCVARVDFISHRLADELIDVVEGWNESLRQPPAACSWFASLDKWDVWIARAIHFSVPVFMAGLALAVLRLIVPLPSNDPITTGALIGVSRWMLISILGLYIVTRFSVYLATQCYRAVNQYGAFVPFSLTRGDEARSERLTQKNNRRLLVFFLSAGFALFLNIVAGIITWWILPAP